MSTAKPHNWRIGDRVEVRGRDVSGEVLSADWIPGRVIADDMATVTVKLDGLAVPRTILADNGLQIRAEQDAGDKVVSIEDLKALSRKEKRRQAGAAVSEMLRKQTLQGGREDD